MKSGLILLGLFWADIVHLKNQGKIEGIAKREGDKVVIETLTGTMTIPAEQVVDIDFDHVSLLERYYEKARGIEKSLQPIEFLELAVWARESRATRFVRPNLDRAIQLANSTTDAKGIQAIAETGRDKGFEAEMPPLWRRLIALEPDNETARRELGYRRHQNQWLSEEEFQAAQGNVKFEGKWVSPTERDLILKERGWKLDQRKKELDDREATVAQNEKSAKEFLAKAEATLREVERRLAEVTERERRVKEREEDLARYRYCSSCRYYYRGLHLCEGAWSYHRCCDGYFRVHHCKK